MSSKQLYSKRRRHQYNVEQWQAIFSDWQLSGLSKAAYCREKQLTISSFDRWYKRLHASKSSVRVDKILSVGGGSALPDSSCPPKGADNLISSFIPVAIADTHAEVCRGEDARLKIELVLSGGHRVCVEGAVWGQVQQFLNDSMRC